MFGTVDLFSVTQRVLFAWVSSFSSLGDLVKVHRGGKIVWYEVSLRGSKPYIARTKTTGTPRFVIYIDAPAVPIDGYAVVHRSKNATVLERVPAVDISQLPLRFGFTEQDIEELSRVARAAGVAALLGTVMPVGIRAPRIRLSEQTNIGVAFWLDGVLRGSQIAFGEHAVRATAQAARGAVLDQRFRPLQKEDMPRVSVEIVRIANVQMPYVGDEIDQTKAYRAVGLLKSQSGWYFPEVYNVRRFAVGEMLGSLAKEKARITHPKFARYFSSEVDDWISSQGGIRRLVGPMPQPSSVAPDLSSVAKRANEMAKRAAAYLARVQESDGSFYTRLSPKSGEKQGFDWARVSFVAWALSVFCEPNTPGYNASLRTAEYIRANKARLHAGDSAMARTALSYAGNLFLQVGDMTETKRIRDLLSQSMTVPLNAIADTQMFSFFKRLSDRGVEVPSFEGQLESQITAFLHRTQLQDDPALWAELALVCRDVLPQHATMVTSYITGAQREDGSFRSLPLRPANVRGTGKVLEVLSVCPQENLEALARGVSWLSSMQYTEDSSFFIPESFKETVFGGFRHDAFDTDAWIDAAGHVLIMAARLSGKTV